MKQLFSRSSLKRSFRKRLLLTTIVLILVPSLIFFIIYSLQFSSDIENRNIELQRTEMKNFTNYLNRTFQTMIINSEYIVSDSSIKQGLIGNYETRLLEKSEFYVRAKAIINNTASGDLRLRIYTENPYLFEYYFFNKMDRLQAAIPVDDYTAIMESGIRWISTIIEDQNGKKYISICRKFQITGNYAAILRTDVSFDMIKAAFNESFDATDSAIYYVDGAGRELMLSDTSYAGSGHTDTYEEKLDTGHTIRLKVSRLPVLKEIFRSYGLIMIIFLLVSGSLISITYFTIRRMTNSLDEFIAFLNTNSFRDIRVENDDEIAVIKRNFLSLLDNNENLYKENLEFLRRRKILELDLMQSKLNPHLLYNSLSVIRWKAVGNYDKETLELIDHLTSYYRAILNRGNNIITFGEELRLLGDYVDICRLAHHQDYQLIVACEDHVREVFLPKVLLQPFVENAVIHGLNGRAGEKIIRITAEIQDDHVMISIYDNGNGIPAATLGKLNQDAQDRSELFGYGIRNVTERVSSAFGSGYSIRFESEVNVYTNVTISFPILPKEELETLFNT
jgi:two-component system, sensor histidine kinase YesM